MQVAFYVPALVLAPACFMVPAPYNCAGEAGNKAEQLWRHLWSWEMFLLGLFGLAVSLPFPYLLGGIFHKAPIEDQVSDHERRCTSMNWRARTFLGWAILVFLNYYMCHWLVFYASEYNFKVFSQWLAAALHSVILRWITFPMFKTTVFTIIVVMTKMGGCCDLCVVLFPFMLPVAHASGGHLEQLPEGAKLGDRSRDGDVEQGGGGSQVSLDSHA